MASLTLSPRLENGGEIYVEGAFTNAYRQASAPSLGRRALSDAEFAADPLWQEPNTFPLIRIDMRETVGVNGVPSLVYYPGNIGHISDTQFAESVYNAVNQTWGLLSRHWPATKPRHWSLLLVGFDGTNGGYGDSGSDLWIARHPDDRYSYSDGSHTLHVCSGYVANSIAASASEMSDCIGAFVSKMANDYDAGQSDLYPMRVWTDCETVGDTVGPSQGLWASAIADSRAATEDNVGTGTMSDYASANADDLDSTAIPAFNGAYNGYHPVNFNFSQRCRTAMELAYMKALNAIVFDACRNQIPSPLSDGNSIACGEWNIIHGNRNNPVLIRPGQSDYFGNLYVATSGCTPIAAMYGSPRIYRPGILTGDAPYDDPRWETLYQWEQHYGIDPGNASVAERERAVMRRSALDMIEQLRNSIANEVDPHIVVSLETFGRMDYVADSAAMMKTAWDSNAVDAFWIFEPNWFNDPAVRRVVAACVRKFNASLGLSPLGAAPSASAGMKRRSIRAR